MRYILPLIIASSLLACDGPDTSDDVRPRNACSPCEIVFDEPQCCAPSCADDPDHPRCVELCMADVVWWPYDVGDEVPADSPIPKTCVFSGAETWSCKPE